jgi:hypothetical protein
MAVKKPDREALVATAKAAASASSLLAKTLPHSHAAFVMVATARLDQELERSIKLAAMRQCLEASELERRIADVEAAVAPAGSTPSLRVGNRGTRSHFPIETDELNQLVAAGTIRAIDRERVRFIVRRIVQPRERPDDPLAENAG